MDADKLQVLIDEVEQENVHQTWFGLHPEAYEAARRARSRTPVPVSWSHIHIALKKAYPDYPWGAADSLRRRYKAAS